MVHSRTSPTMDCLCIKTTYKWFQHILLSKHLFKKPVSIFKWFISVNNRVAFLCLWMGGGVLTPDICVYWLYSRSDYSSFLESSEGILQRTPSRDSFVLLRRNTRTENEIEIWKRVVWRNASPWSGILLLEFCTYHGLSTTNILLKHKGVLI